MDISRYKIDLLGEDAISALYKGTSENGTSVLMLTAISAETENECQLRCERALSLAESLEIEWAAKPLSLERYGGRTFLLLHDAGGTPLAAEMGKPFAIGRFLNVALGAVSALRQLHYKGVIHKDLRPDRILADAAGRVWLCGFGKAGASSTSYELSPTAPGMSDSLPYVAPEQTGRMKRPVDARSDLYSLGVVLYQMLTGELPFLAADMMEWIHSHVARRPIPPSQRLDPTPPVLESILIKLLSKNPDDRYQTAAGLENDLRRCLDSWEAAGQVADFQVATADAAEGLQLPDRLYGRSNEVALLKDVLSDVRSKGARAVALVSGPTGVGKSALIREFRKDFSSNNCLFASGKSDQYTRSIPYAAIAEAFRGLVRQILGYEDEELARWRVALTEALGPNGQLMTGLIPELVLVIGEQPPPPETPPYEAKARFNLVFRRFLMVFARPEHPLALFIDDVQWLDQATIELIERTALDDEVSHLLLICAYRDNEVGPGHPLRATSRVLEAGVCRFEEISLCALDSKALRQLLADVLRTDVLSVDSLADLIAHKTGGNPFFVLHFLEALELEGAVTYDQRTGGRIWNEGRIRATRITDNVADLVISKLSRLPNRALEMVKLMSCLGNGASVETLAVITGKPRQQVIAILWDGVAGGLLMRSNGDFVLVHDRVQEAAYRMVPEVERAHVHFHIGQALMSNLPPDALKKRIFEVADQFVRGLEHVVSSGQRERVANLFLEAGKRARVSVAYQSALKYLRTGLALLGEDAWHDYCLRFSLELQRAECEYLSGEHQVAEAHLIQLSMRARNRVDRGAVVGLRSSLYLTLGDQDKAVGVALDYLREFGIDWSAHPSDEQVRAGIDQLYEQLGGRQIRGLLELPRMTDPDWLAAMEVLAYTILPAIITDGNLEDLIYAQMVSLSLRHGNCDASCYAYVSVIIPLGLRFGDYEAGGQFGKVGLDLVDHHGLDRFKARVYSCYGCYVIPWTQNLNLSESYARKSIQVAVEAADLVFSATPAQALVSHLLVRGRELETVQEDALHFLAAARKIGFSLAADAAIAQLLLIRELRGVDVLEQEGGLPDTDTFEQYLRDAGERRRIVMAWYWIHRIQTRFLAGDYLGAIAASREAQGGIRVRSFIEVAEYEYYSALAHAAAASQASDVDRGAHLEAMLRHQIRIDAWSRSAPDNFANRRLLLAAERARLEGRHMDALQLYEQASTSARQNGFVQNEAIASELAWRFCSEIGLSTTADAFLRNARACYKLWGAHGKLRQLDTNRRGLLQHEDKAATPLPDGQPLDMAAVLAMSQAVSGEIILDRLIERLMVTVVEHSGAVKGLLLLPGKTGMRIVAEAVTGDRGVSVILENFRRSLPETILAYVTRTQEAVIRAGVGDDDPFAEDAYFHEAPSKSVLCLPIVKLKRLVGVLYLENDLSANVFTPDQAAVLQLLASQAAISLENAELYQASRDTHEKMRRTAEELRVAYDTIPALVWTGDVDGTLLSFNKRWHDFTGLTREESMGDGWARAIHPEDIGKVGRKWREVLQVGEAGEIEARMLRFDGAVRSFLIRATPMRDERGAIIKWYGSNVDIDELKRMEEAQELLARAGRLTALGELTASIAHEVNQPLMAIVMNAATCLKWLSDDQLDVAEARQAAERIIGDGHRAGDVIASIRALARKAPLSVESVHVNGMVESVIILTRGELQKHGVALSTVLDPDAGMVVGDRIQLQQVVLNLILNAVEAMVLSGGDKRILQLRTERLGDGKTSVAVADSGPGVEPLKREQIFDAFFTTKEAGLGMGLSICRSIVEAHGGSLWVAPNQPVGSVFSFSLKSGGLLPNH